MNTPSEGISRQISEEFERHLLLFEQTWGQQDAPSIEQLLSEVPEAERANLLRELLFIEFEFIQRKATEPLTEQYLSRFPEYGKIVLEVAQAVGEYAVFKYRNIAGYTLLAELGRGGMGTVYKAKSDLLNTLVAFKIVNQRVIDNPESLKRFIRELEMIGRLKHLNIVEAKHAGVTDDGTPYLVMEFVEGITLAQWGKQNPPSGSGVVQEPVSSVAWSKLSPIETSGQRKAKPKSNGQSESSRIAKACDIIRATALGLQAIHEAGLVHRDIKPGNIMLLPDGQVKILDLGLAKLRERIAEHPSEYALTQCAQTQLGQFLGTPGYIAPEQMHSAANVDIRADIYSLGCTFFYLLYGRTPSERPVDDIPISLPKNIRDILNKMLAADPEARFQEPREVVDALDSFLGRKKKVHWKTLVAAALSFAVFLGIFLGIFLSSKNPNHATISSAPPYVPPNHTVELIDVAKFSQTQQIAATVQEATRLRHRGNTEDAEGRLRTLAKDLRENPFEGSDNVSAEVLSALGDCYFFGGFAGDLLNEKNVQRMADWYNEAWNLAENLPEDFRTPLLCKRAIVNNAFDMLSQEEHPSMYHHFAAAVLAKEEQALHNFIELTEENQDLRLFALERLISRAMNDRAVSGGSEKLPEYLKALDTILLTPYPDKDASVYLHRFFDWAIRATSPTEYNQLQDYLFQLRLGTKHPSIPRHSALVLFYFSLWSDENGFVVYFPTDRPQEAQRLVLPFNRTAIKEAIRKGEKLELPEPLVSQVRRDIASGVPIVLSWDDTACWSLRRDAISLEDWCFDTSFTIKEIMGELK